jgi:hypothetical protein
MNNTKHHLMTRFRQRDSYEIKRKSFKSSSKVPSTAEIKSMLSSFDKGNDKNLEHEHRKELNY